MCERPKSNAKITCLFGMINMVAWDDNGRSPTHLEWQSTESHRNGEHLENASIICSNKDVIPPDPRVLPTCTSLSFQHP